MSRPNKPWFRKSNRRWYVWFNGKQVNLGPDKQAADQQFHALMALPKEHRSIPNTPDISLAEVADHFLDWVQRHRAPDTYEWYRYRLERLCRKYPKMMAMALRPYHIDDWVSEFDVSQSTQRNFLRSIKRCYRWAKRQGYLADNPIAEIEVPSAEARDVAISKQEFDRLLAFVRNDSFRDLLITTWESGCRPQESLRVEARHVDVANQRWVFHQSESKTKRISRVVYLTDTAMRITESQMQRYPTGPLFRNAQGKCWTKDSVGCAFGAIQVRMGKEVMAAQGIAVNDDEIERFIPTLNPNRTTRGRQEPKPPAQLRCEAKRKLTQRLAAQLAPRYSLYALRHSFATNALRKGIDSMTVAVLLGHKDPSTLARVYQHLNQNPQHLLSEARRAAG